MNWPILLGGIGEDKNQKRNVSLDGLADWPTLLVDIVDICELTEHY